MGPLRSPLALLAPLATVALASACAAPPPVDQVLDVSRALDERAAAARARAAGQPDDLEARVEAARALFLAADMRVQRGIAQWLEATPEATLKQIIDAQDRLPAEIRDEVAALCLEGLDHADAAIELAPEEVAPRHYRALNLGMVAWAEGAASALFSGRGTRIASSIAAALERDRTFEGGAPLRLEGRFRTLAPWPYGDRRKALRVLEEAAELGPVPVTLLFLGDVQYLTGQEEAARKTWQGAIDAPADGATRETAAFHRAQARRRLQAGEAE